MQAIRQDRQEAPGYPSVTRTGMEKPIVRIICDNPKELKPDIRQQRKIPEYLEKLKEKTHDNIRKILSKFL